MLCEELSQKETVRNVCDCFETEVTTINRMQKQQMLVFCRPLKRAVLEPLFAAVNGVPDRRRPTNCTNHQHYLERTHNSGREVAITIPNRISLHARKTTRNPGVRQSRLSLLPFHDSEEK